MSDGDPLTGYICDFAGSIIVDAAEVILLQGALVTSNTAPGYKECSQQWLTAIVDSGAVSEQHELFMLVLRIPVQQSIKLRITITVAGLWTRLKSVMLSLETDLSKNSAYWLSVTKCSYGICNPCYLKDCA